MTQLPLETALVALCEGTTTQGGFTTGLPTDRAPVLEQPEGATKRGDIITGAPGDMPPTPAHPTAAAECCCATIAESGLAADTARKHGGRGKPMPAGAVAQGGMIGVAHATVASFGEVMLVEDKQGEATRGGLTATLACFSVELCSEDCWTWVLAAVSRRLACSTARFMA